MEPDRPSAVVGLAAVLLLVLANAFFVAAEFALVGARKTRLDEFARTGDRKARLARRAVQSLDRYISANQLGITLGVQTRWEIGVAGALTAQRAVNEDRSGQFHGRIELPC